MTKERALEVERINMGISMEYNKVYFSSFFHIPFGFMSPFFDVPFFITIGGSYVIQKKKKKKNPCFY